MDRGTEPPLCPYANRELEPGDDGLGVGAAAGERGERVLLAGDAGAGDAEEGHLAMAWACPPPRNAAA